MTYRPNAMITEKYRLQVSNRSLHKDEILRVQAADLCEECISLSGAEGLYSAED